MNLPYTSADQTLLLYCCMLTAKINEETGEDMDDNVYFDECDVDDDDIDEVY